MSSSRFHPMSEAYLSIYEGKKRGLWDNIHAKRKRGEPPAKKGDKDYPETLNVEGVEEVDEAMKPGPRQRAMADKMHQQYRKGGGTYSSRDRAHAHNIAVRNEGPGTPGYEKKSTGGKGARFAGYGDRGMGNKAARRMGKEPMRGNTRKEEFEQVDEGSLKQARKNVGASTCWDGYKAKGTKMKNGKSVPNCVKEEYIEYLLEKRFASDLEAAETMYLHMSDLWKQTIDEEKCDSMRGKVDYSKPPQKKGGPYGKSNPTGRNAVDEFMKKKGK